MTDTGHPERAEAIKHPAVGQSAYWQTLEALWRAEHEGRPDGKYQGGLRRDELLAATGIEVGDYNRLLDTGCIVERGCYFGGDRPPDECWGVEITPRGNEVVDFGHMQTFLSSIASAKPQSEQAEWMVNMARQGLRLDASPEQEVPDV
jgi:hypothetical protein